mmetsp:Transcript_7520/g.16481  ORF Transcript_7520/g.16481 Transcript_7520/m.16481 type:complete len:112 (-) Transcript_7520:514-849(-)
MVIRAMRRDDGPAANRALRLGIKRRTLRALLDTGFDTSSPYGRWRFLCAVIGHNTLRRGGEFGTTDGETWASVAETKGSRWQFVQFFPHGHVTVGGRPFCIDWVLPIKDTD